MDIVSKINNESAQYGLENGLKLMGGIAAGATLFISGRYLRNGFRAKSLARNTNHLLTQNYTPQEGKLIRAKFNTTLKLPVVRQEINAQPRGWGAERLLVSGAENNDIPLLAPSSKHYQPIRDMYNGLGVDQAEVKAAIRQANSGPQVDTEGWLPFSHGQMPAKPVYPEKIRPLGELLENHPNRVLTHPWFRKHL